MQQFDQVQKQQHTNILPSDSISVVLGSKRNYQVMKSCNPPTEMNYDIEGDVEM
jgi:hypothetical protein